MKRRGSQSPAVWAVVAACMSLALPGSGSFYLGKLSSAVLLLILSTVGPLAVAVFWQRGWYGGLGAGMGLAAVLVIAHLGGAVVAILEALNVRHRRRPLVVVGFLVASAAATMVSQEVRQRWFLASYTVGTIAMEPTLLLGDRVLVIPGDGRLVQRGDLVALHVPDKAQHYVRRVIGIEGDRMEVAGGTPVPPGHIFAARDRRDGSPLLGMVPRSWVRGVVMDVWWSHGEGAVRLERIGLRVAPGAKRDRCE